MPRQRATARPPSRRECTLVLDSGAFSAWTRGEVPDLEAYGRFALEMQPYVEHIVNMDMIPASFGERPTAAQVEASAQEGWANLLYLEGLGLSVMPVFHQGEELKWLDRMIEHGCDYVGISPANDRSTSGKRVWLDEVFYHITDADGWPVVKTHGFGMTSVELMWRYPWFSCDSTSWSLMGGYGKVMIPKVRNGELRFDLSPTIVDISEGSSAIHDHGKHWSHLPQWMRDKVAREYFEPNDTDEQKLAEHYLNRDRLNLAFFQEVAKRKPDLPFAQRRKRFLL